MANEQFNHHWFWKKKLPERNGELCRVLVRENKMNSILVEFQSDKFKVVTSKWAVRLIKKERNRDAIPPPTDEQVELWKQIYARANR